MERKIQAPKANGSFRNLGNADKLFEKEMTGVKPLQHKQATLKRAQATPTQPHHPNHDAETIEGADVPTVSSTGSTAGRVEEPETHANFRRVYAGLPWLHVGRSNRSPATICSERKSTGLARHPHHSWKGTWVGECPVLKTIVDRWPENLPMFWRFVPLNRKTVDGCSGHSLRK
jgi:hypothetical protein